jgi:hypothetical protein
MADDENAPVAIIHGAGKGRTSDGGASYNQNKGWDASADPLANLQERSPGSAGVAVEV